MTLIDAYGLVALFADEPSAPEVQAVLRAGGSAVVAVNLAEAIDISRRVHELPASEVRRALEPLVLAGLLDVAASGEAEAWRALDVRATYYHRSTCPISMADAFLLAHALEGGHDLATSDPAVARVARREGVSVIALADRNGKRP